jgi:hypothetical protein
METLCLQGWWSTEWYLYLTYYSPYMKLLFVSCHAIHLSSNYLFLLDTCCLSLYWIHSYVLLINLEIGQWVVIHILTIIIFGRFSSSCGYESMSLIYRSLMVHSLMVVTYFWNVENVCQWRDATPWSLNLLHNDSANEGLQYACRFAAVVLVIVWSFGCKVEFNSRLPATMILM